MKGHIITGRAVTTDDAKKAGLIPGEPAKKMYRCRTCGATCHASDPPANVDHGCKKAWWWKVRNK